MSKRTMLVKGGVKGGTKTGVKTGVKRAAIPQKIAAAKSRRKSPKRRG